MGLKDLFSKEGRAKSALAKNLGRAVNKHAQSFDRQKALEALAADGSDEALVGLMRRFDMTYDKSIEDENEKTYCYQALKGKGAAVIPALRQGMKEAQSYSWPLRLMEDVGTAADLEAVVGDLVARHPAGYERDPSRKIQFIQWIAEQDQLPSTKMATLLVAYLDDVDEGVRFQTVGALKVHKDENVAREPLLKRFVNPEEESLRLRLRILELFADAGWAVTGYRPSVEERLPEQFLLDAKGFVKKKA